MLLCCYLCGAMNREFLLNILFLLFVNLLIKPFYVFGVELTIQNEVGKEAYGLYFALFNFTLTLQIVSDLGIYNFNNRHIAQHPYLLSKYFSPMLVAKGLLSLLYFSWSSALALLFGCKIMAGVFTRCCCRWLSINYFPLYFYFCVPTSPAWRCTARIV